MSENPLKKLYRSKSFYLSLPSQGNFYPSGINLSVDGEIGIMPMTARDEITLKGPDVLFNGEALYEIFKSCVPDIANPAEIPQCDVDSLLIGIRMAAGKKTMGVKCACPKCKHEDEYELNLGHMLGSAVKVENDGAVKLDDGTVVNVRPYSLKSQLKSRIQSFHQYKLQQLMNDDMDEAERKEIFDKTLLESSLIQISIVADNIISVEIDEGDTVVTENEHIFDWLQNISSETHKLIVNKMREMSDNKMSTEYSIACTECGHEYKTNLDIDPVNFF